MNLIIYKNIMCPRKLGFITLKAYTYFLFFLIIIVPNGIYILFLYLRTFIALKLTEFNKICRMILVKRL